MASMLQDADAATTMRVASHLQSMTVEDLPFSATRSASRCVLDLIGCGVAGRSGPAVSTVVERGTRWAREAFQQGKASVWLDEARLSAPGAAFVNSLAASMLDVDDGHRSASGHPGAAVIPAALAVAETLRARWEDVLLAMVCGYQAGIAVAAARASSPSATGATGRWSAVAVAVAAGKLMGLTARQLAHAIALAETQAPNMSAADHAGFAGSDAKEGIPWSVVTGLAAAEQAALGFKGYLGSLDNAAVYRPGVISQFIEGPFLIETAYFKPYACCRWTHSAIDAVLDMRSTGLDPSRVTNVEIATFRRAISLENLARPADIVAAQFSIPFVVSVALLAGANALLPMSPELLARKDVRVMAERIVLVLDPDLEACFPAQVPARVTVNTTKGVFERVIHIPRGDPAAPMSNLDLIEKAVRLCHPARSAEDVRRLADIVLRSSSIAEEVDSLEAVLHFLAYSPGTQS